MPKKVFEKSLKFWASHRNTPINILPGGVIIVPINISSQIVNLKYFKPIGFVTNAKKYSKTLKKAKYEEIFQNSASFSVNSKKKISI